MRRHLVRTTLHLVIIGLACIGTTPSAFAARKATKESATQRAKPRTEKSDSGETQAERDRRLYRECQGLPNAGACAGYTRR